MSTCTAPAWHKSNEVVRSGSADDLGAGPIRVVVVRGSVRVQHQADHLSTGHVRSQLDGRVLPGGPGLRDQPVVGPDLEGDVTVAALLVVDTHVGTQARAAAGRVVVDL